jgi:hypothetical protein
MARTNLHRSAHLEYVGTSVELTIEMAEASGGRTILHIDNKQVALESTALSDKALFPQSLTQVLVQSHGLLAFVEEPTGANESSPQLRDIDRVLKLP